MPHAELQFCARQAALQGAHDIGQTMRQDAFKQPKSKPPRDGQAPNFGELAYGFIRQPAGLWQKRSADFGWPDDLVVPCEQPGAKPVLQFLMPMLTADWLRPIRAPSAVKLRMSGTAR